MRPSAPDIGELMLSRCSPRVRGAPLRGLLRAIDFDAGDRRLAELAPAQKTKQLSSAGAR